MFVCLHWPAPFSHGQCDHATAPTCQHSLLPVSACHVGCLMVAAEDAAALTGHLQPARQKQPGRATHQAYQYVGCAMMALVLYDVGKDILCFGWAPIHVDRRACRHRYTLACSVSASYCVCFFRVVSACCPSAASSAQPSKAICCAGYKEASASET